jgi:hypothetical protein
VIGIASEPDLLEENAWFCADGSAVLSARRADRQLPPAEHTSPAITSPYASFFPNALKNDRPGSESLALCGRTDSLDQRQRVCRVARHSKMIGKPDLTDEMGNRGASEKQSCGFACEAFCTSGAFLNSASVSEARPLGRATLATIVYRINATVRRQFSSVKRSCGASDTLSSMLVVDYSEEIFYAPPGRSIPRRAAMRYSVLRLMPRISAVFLRLPPVASKTCSR